MSWWWAGVIGAAKVKNKKNSEHHNALKPQNVALEVGVTSIIGSSLAEILPWKVCGVAQDAQPNRRSSTLEYVKCNNLDQDETHPLSIGLGR